MLHTMPRDMHSHRTSSVLPHSSDFEPLRPPARGLWPMPGLRAGVDFLGLGEGNRNPFRTLELWHFPLIVARAVSLVLFP